MTPKAIYSESRTAQTAAHLHANRMKFEEDVTGSGDSDPWATSEADDRFATYIPEEMEELEVFDFDEVKGELGSLNWE